jgi:hypothetical protein
MATTTNVQQNNVLRTVIIVGLLVAAFLGAYRFAQARSNQAAASSPAAQSAAAPAGQQAPASDAAAASGGCCGSSDGASGAASGGCCGSGSGATTTGGVTGDRVEGTAQTAGGVQAIAVKVSTTYSPNVIKLKAGIPAEITFGQGSGCTSQIISKDLGFSTDVSAGPQTVKIPSPQKGTYSFSCSMGMVFGQIVVE